jgi:Flp pilus assembly pilin Flp
LLAKIAITLFDWIVGVIACLRQLRSLWPGAYDGFCAKLWEVSMFSFLSDLWSKDEGQDIAEYAVMLAVILVIVVGTIRLIGSNANKVFSSVASSVQ